MHDDNDPISYGQIITRGGDVVQLYKGKLYTRVPMDDYGVYQFHKVEVEDEIFSCEWAGRQRTRSKRFRDVIEFPPNIGQSVGYYRAKSLVIEDGAERLWLGGLMVDDPVYVPSSVTELIFLPSVQISNIDELVHNDDINLEFMSIWKED